jgi:tRNA(Arg) A34 adenosine deaminase TadA
MADPIKQPAVASPAAFMRRVLNLAAVTKNAGRGNAYGAVIVWSDKLIGKGANNSRPITSP